MKRLRNILINIMVMGVFSFVALVIGEGAIRLIAPQQLIVINTGVWVPDNYFSWAHAPNANTTINTGEQEVNFITDAQGFRINSAEDYKQNHQAPKSVLTIGDSFLEAVQVENDSTMNEVMRRTLEQKFGEEIYFANTGVGGWSPNQYYMMAKQELARRDYDLGIVYVYSANDFITDFDTTLNARQSTGKHPFKFPTSFSFNDWKYNVLYPINDWLEQHSQLYILFRNSSKTLLSRVGLTAHYFPKVFYKKEKTSDRWNNTAYICQKIQKEFDKREIPLLFIILPTPYQVNEDVFYEYIKGFEINPDSVDLELPNTAFAAALNTHDIYLMDPLTHMREINKKGAPQFGSVDNHLNELGHRVVADFLADSVANYLFEQP